MEVAVETMWPGADFDEFSLLEEYARYEGLPWHGRPTVDRRSFDVGAGQRVSAVQWGSGPPELVLLHGGGQNAHTWDTVALALDRPLLALDLPGHGHSDWRDDRDYWPIANARAVASVLDQLAVTPRAVVGMSLGGLTTIRLASVRADLAAATVIVDVTPGVAARTPKMTDEQRGATALTQGPRTYPTFDDMVQATATATGRAPGDVWRGVRHNARQLEDGTWGWRYDRLRDEGAPPLDFSPLWDDLAAIAAPVMLVRGGRSAHVHDDDVEEFRKRQAGVRVEVVEGAGHSVQSDRPVVLAGLIADFLTGAG